MEEFFTSFLSSNNLSFNQTEKPEMSYIPPHYSLNIQLKKEKLREGGAPPVEKGLDTTQENLHTFLR